MLRKNPSYWIYRPIFVDQYIGGKSRSYMYHAWYIESHKINDNRGLLPIQHQVITESVLAYYLLEMFQQM